MRVEIAQDSRIRPLVRLDIGAVLAPEELAADKTLALFGRAYARDLVDVAALADRWTLEELLGWAEEKDAGFDQHRFADALAVAAEEPQAEFTRLGLDAAQIEALRQRARAWSRQLS